MKFKNALTSNITSGLMLASIILMFTGCAGNTRSCDDQNSLSIDDITLPNGKVDSNYSVDLLKIIKANAVKSIRYAETIDKDTTEKYGLVLWTKDGELSVIGPPKKSGLNILFGVRVTENAKIGCPERSAIFKVTIAEIRP